MNFRGLSSWLLMLVPFLCGCIPPITVRTAPVAESLDGTRSAPPVLPEAGRTTRLEVDENYHDFRVDVGTPSLYWAHLYRSDRRVWMGLPDQRAWASLNIVTAFDSNQVVKLVRVFSDAQLPEQVALMSEQGLLPALDATAPIKLEAERYPMTAHERSLSAAQMPVTILVAQRTLTLSATVSGSWIPPRSARPATVTVPRQQVMDLWMLNPGPQSSLTDRAIDAHLRFKPKTQLGSYIAFKVTFADALTLARWMASPALDNPGILKRPAQAID